MFNVVYVYQELTGLSAYHQPNSLKYIDTLSRSDQVREETFLYMQQRQHFITFNWMTYTL